MTRKGTINNPRLDREVRVAIETVLLRGWCMVYEPGSGGERKHPRYVVFDSAGEVVAKAKTQERVLLDAWLEYVFSDTA